jgi:hypothetical protein
VIYQSAISDQLYWRMTPRPERSSWRPLDWWFDAFPYEPRKYGLLTHNVLKIPFFYSAFQFILQVADIKKKSRNIKIIITNVCKFQQHYFRYNNNLCLRWRCNLAIMTWYLYLYSNPRIVFHMCIWLHICQF